MLRAEGVPAVKISPRTAALANLNHWRAGQGARIKANRPVEIYRACEHMAMQWAPVRDPLVLETKAPKDGKLSELEVCVMRAISQERHKLHGPLGRITADEWWEQIDAIAKRWGIKTTREQWERSTKTEAKKEAA
jgi:hypothetical protein